MSRRSQHQGEYERISHTHCWNQKQPSACGIPLDRHAQCCLCDVQTPNPVSEAIEKLAWKYVAGSGCANCWGDLHQGCESTCRSSEEADAERQAFIEEIHRIATLSYARGVEDSAKVCEALNQIAYEIAVQEAAKYGHEVVWKQPYAGNRMIQLGWKIGDKAKEAAAAIRKLTPNTPKV